MAYAGRLLIGAGSGFGWVAALKIIAERFPPDRFAMMSGAGMSIGLWGGFSGQVIAGSLVDAFGWRITMWGAAIAGLLLSVDVMPLSGDAPRRVRWTHRTCAKSCSVLLWHFETIKFGSSREAERLGQRRFSFLARSGVCRI